MYIDKAVDVPNRPDEMLKILKSSKCPFYDMVKQMVSPSSRERPDPSKLLDTASGAPGSNIFATNEYVKACIFLESLPVRDANEREIFFKVLGAQIDSFPPRALRYKFLPQLRNALDLGMSPSLVLSPFLKCGASLTEAEFHEAVLPTVVKLFSSNDRYVMVYACMIYRAVRMKLLQHLDAYISHLNTNTVSDKIFPSIINGFTDTSSALREQTVKSMVIFAPKLNPRVLDSQLLPFLAKLQMVRDGDGYDCHIRMQTRVCVQIQRYV